MNLSKAYDLITSVASPSDAEGLKKERSILLLWYLRNALGIDDLEAYEYVCDGEGDKGIDGLYLEDAPEDQDKQVLHLFQSKYPTKPKNIGETEVQKTIGVSVPFETADGLRALLKGQVAPELRSLIERFELERLLDDDKLIVESTLVTAGALTDDARALIKAENASKGRVALRGVDALDLAPLIEAFRSPATVSATISVAATREQRFVASIENARLVVCSVKCCGDCGLAWD